MEYFHSGFDWMDKLMPQGIPLPSTTILTGPGGAGRPLIGAMIENAWLRNGGTLIHLLINFDREYVVKLLEHFNNNLKKYEDQIVYIEFDPLLNGVEKIDHNILRANLLKPKNLELAIEAAKIILQKSNTSPLIYGSAMNMLLFSKTYNQSIHKKIVDLLKSDNNSLFTISNNIFDTQAADWEEAADNLFYSHGTGIMRLAFKIIKMKTGSFNNEEVEVPLSENELRSIRSEAEKSRKHLIPVIKQI